jgi:formiminotetrahydrofolate cyclodeaminase
MVAPEQPEAAAASTPQALTGWLERLAAADGGQGGGAACGVLLGIAAALMEMVARYSTDDPRAGACAVRLSDRRGAAIRAADADGMHSAALGASLRVAEDDPDRDRGIHEAALAAAASSAALGAVGIALVAELALLTEIGDPNVRADLAVGAEALSAGIAAAAVNLRADLGLWDAHASDEFRDESAGALAEAVRALQDARDAASAYAARLSDRDG